MPYIKQDKRKAYDDALQKLHRTVIVPGELNYCITKICDNFIGDQINYDKLNTIIGVLECVKNEYYRRVVTPYEDRKCCENGDVYKTD